MDWISDDNKNLLIVLAPILASDTTQKYTLNIQREGKKLTPFFRFCSVLLSVSIHMKSKFSPSHHSQDQYSEAKTLSL